MKAKILISPQAEADTEDAYTYIRERAPETAVRWRQSLLESIHSLSRFPLRHEIAPEARSVGADLRHKLFGVYRILYSVRDDIVCIHGLRHGARRPLRSDELPDDS